VLFDDVDGHPVELARQHRLAVRLEFGNGPLGPYGDDDRRFAGDHSGCSPGTDAHRDHTGVGQEVALVDSGYRGDPLQLLVELRGHVASYGLKRMSRRLTTSRIGLPTPVVPTSAVSPAKFRATGRLVAMSIQADPESPA
jgi:hypothetical protein